MSSSSTLASGSRRRLLALSGLSLLIPLLPVACSTDSGKPIGWMRLGVELTGLDEPTIGRIGELWRPEFTTTQLTQSLPSLSSGDWHPNGVVDASIDEVLVELEQRARDQYRQKQVDTVERWILSELELAIVSLAARV